VSRDHFPSVVDGLSRFLDAVRRYAIARVDRVANIYTRRPRRPRPFIGFTDVYGSPLPTRAIVVTNWRRPTAAASSRPRGSFRRVVGAVYTGAKTDVKTYRVLNARLFGEVRIKIKTFAFESTSATFARTTRSLQTVRRKIVKTDENAWFARPRCLTRIGPFGRIPTCRYFEYRREYLANESSLVWAKITVRRKRKIEISPDRASIFFY